MKYAMIEAQKLETEIPVGAVIVYRNEIISAAHNLKETLNDATAHAEILAIRKAADFFGSWHLDECDMYVTLEPCPMCAWAIRESRIKRLYFGAYDKNYGAAGSYMNLLNSIEVYGGISEESCTELLVNFFKNKRNM
jgi:tRNA(adenine34) deaminase